MVRAVAALSQGRDDGRAYAQLRSLAMGWQVTIEEAARRIVAMTGEEGAMTSPIAPDSSPRRRCRPARAGVWRRLRSAAGAARPGDHRDRRGRRDPRALAHRPSTPTSSSSTG